MNAEARASTRAFIFRVTEAEYASRQALADLAGVRRFLRHDFRTPLSVLVGHAQLLAEGMGSAPRSVRLMFEQVKHLDALVDALGANRDLAVPALIWLLAPPSSQEQLGVACVGHRVWVIDDDSELPEPGELIARWPMALSVDRFGAWILEQRRGFL